MGNKKKLPVGIEFFDDIIQQNFYYPREKQRFENLARHEATAKPEDLIDILPYIVSIHGISS